MKDNKKVKFLYFLLLFLILSLFTVYPHIDLLFDRSETVIDNNVKDSNGSAAYILNKDDYISTAIYINDKLKALSFKFDTSSINSNIKVELHQGSIVEVHEIPSSKDIDKVINIHSKFISGKLNIKIVNIGEGNVSYIVNYPQTTSGYIKLNGQNDIQAFSLYIKTIYSGSDFFLVSLIVFIIIILIQGYISYIIVAAELQDNRVYWLSALLFLLVCILRFPLYTFWAEPIAETFTLYIHANVDSSVSILDMLFVRDFSMTYFTSLINIVSKILGLDKYLVVYLYMTGIIIACLWLALFTRISLRKYFPDYIRLIFTFSLLSMWNSETFYLNSMFIYWGIYFIIFMYLIDIDKLSRTKYILGMVLIFLIVNNKMSYIFLIPSAFLMIFYYGFRSKRKLYMQIVIIISCLMNYIVFSMFSPSDKKVDLNIFERIFDVGQGIIRLMNGIASFFNLHIIFPTYTQLSSLLIIIPLLIYSIYLMIKNKNIRNSGYIIIVILVAVFMSQYIHVISDFPTVAQFKVKFNSFNKLPYFRGFYMLYVSIYMLVVYILYLIYKKNHDIISTILIIFVFVILGLQQQNFNYDTIIKYPDYYRNKYTEYYHFLKNSNISIPMPSLWNYSINASNKIYLYKDNVYTDLESTDIVNKFYNLESIIYNKFNKLDAILANKCIISMHNNYVDIQYNKGKITANFYDKSGNLITKQIQLNKNNYYKPTGSSMSFIFQEPICNIDRIEFTDEENKPVWVTGRIILGVVQ